MDRIPFAPLARLSPSDPLDSTHLGRARHRRAGRLVAAALSLTLFGCASAQPDLGDPACRAQIDACLERCGLGPDGPRNFGDEVSSSSDDRTPCEAACYACT